MIIGPRAELQLRRALQVGGGDVSYLLSEPLAVGIYVVIAVVLGWPLLRRLVRRRRPASGDAAPTVDEVGASTTRKGS